MSRNETRHEKADSNTKFYISELKVTSSDTSVLDHNLEKHHALLGLNLREDWTALK